MQIVTRKELLDGLAERNRGFEKIERRVAGIINRVRDGGESALRELTETYDRVKIRDFRVSQAEINAARREFLTLEWQARLQRVSRRIRDFAEKEIPSGFRIAEPEGVLERVYAPIEPVGVYIPAGTAPLISTVLMTIVPAQAAGVKKIVVVTPPDGKGKANPAVVAACVFLGIREIYKIGGAQAIAALAFGAGSIPKVAKIVGPGNEYVAAAKRLLYGIVDVDCPAGPSEVAVYADRTAVADYVRAELAGQAEHRGGLAILISTDRKILAEVGKTAAAGFAVYVPDERQAADLIEAVAPEHLVVMSKKPTEFAAGIKKAGAIFLGNYSPVALGDYLAGPSHVLPTNGAAASFSGLSALTFLRSFSRINWNKKGLAKWSDDIVALAELEGLAKHRDSVKVRLR